MVKRTKRIWRWLGVLLVLMTAGLILAVSMARASLSLTLKKERENTLRKIPIKLLLKGEDGEIRSETYLLPPVRTLPDNVFYNVKRIRDWLWVGFCQKKNEKVSLAILLADKKMAEAQILFVNGRADEAMKAAVDGITLLTRAKKLWMDQDKKIGEYKVVEVKIRMAELAYEKILRRAEGAVDINQTEYEQIINKLDEI